MCARAPHQQQKLLCAAMGMRAIITDRQQQRGPGGRNVLDCCGVTPPVITQRAHKFSWFSMATPTRDPQMPQTDLCIMCVRAAQLYKSNTLQPRKQQLLDDCSLCSLLCSQTLSSDRIFNFSIQLDHKNFATEHRREIFLHSISLMKRVK